MFFNENESNYVKTIISSDTGSHIAITISVKTIAIKFLFVKSCSPTMHQKLIIILVLEFYLSQYLWAFYSNLALFDRDW